MYTHDILFCNPLTLAMYSKERYILKDEEKEKEIKREKESQLISFSYLQKLDTQIPLLIIDMDYILL